jgi:hypothetical protein
MEGIPIFVGIGEPLNPEAEVNLGEVPPILPLAILRKGRGGIDRRPATGPCAKGFGQQPCQLLVI